MIKRTFAAFLILSLVFALASCGGDKTFGHCELRIPLSDGFSERDAEGFDVAYSNGDLAVAILRISFAAGYDEGIPETLMPNEFAAYYLYRTDRRAEIVSEYDFAYYEFSESYESGEYYHLMSFYRSKWAYFAVLFSSREEMREVSRGIFLEYADAAYFVEYEEN